MSKKNYYDVLGVVHTISQPDLIKAFRKLIVSKHPDKTPNNPQVYQEFLLITEAYGVLGDPSKRRRYDVGDVGDGMNDRTPHTTHHSTHNSSFFFTRFSMAHGTPLDQAFDQDNSGNDEGYAAGFQEEDLFMKRKQTAQ